MYYFLFKNNFIDFKIILYPKFSLDFAQEISSKVHLMKMALKRLSDVFKVT